MRRRSPTERIEPYRRRSDGPGAFAIGQRLSEWTRTIESSVTGAWPQMPSGIEDRDADVWEALLAIADAAGGEWPERAREAAVSLVTASKENSPSLGVQLLSDLRKIFGEAQAMTTEDALTKLISIDESPWGDLRGRPLDSRGMSNRLRPYGIAPKTIRQGASTAKGYRRDDLHDAWQRYLPASPSEAETNVTTGTDTAAVPDVTAVTDPRPDAQADSAEVIDI
jgi:hypothetical protein